MNSELKVIIFEQKKILQNLLKLLDEQYNLVLNKDVIALGKIAEDIEEEGKRRYRSSFARDSWIWSWKWQRNRWKKVPGSWMSIWE